MSDILDNAKKTTGGIVLSPSDNATPDAAPPNPEPIVDLKAWPPSETPSQSQTATPIVDISQPIPPSEPPPEPISAVRNEKPVTPPKSVSANSETLIVPPPSVVLSKKTTEAKQQTAPKSDDKTGSLGGNEKKKPKLGVILAALLLLLITLPIGIFYISQQQQLTDIRSRANSPPAPYPGTAQQCKDGGGEVVSEPGGECGSGGYRNECHTGGKWYKIDCGNNPNPTEKPPCKGDNCGPNNTPTNTPIKTPTNTPIMTPSGTPQVTETPTNTPTGAYPQCTNIKVFKDDVQLDADGLKKLVPGDEVVITVAGGNATKAHIRVNGGAWSESSTTNAGGEYTFNYTIPSNITSFTIESEIFGTDGIWH